MLSLILYRKSVFAFCKKLFRFCLPVDFATFFFIRSVLLYIHKPFQLNHSYETLHSCVNCDILWLFEVSGMPLPIISCICVVKSWPNLPFSTRDKPSALVIIWIAGNSDSFPSRWLLFRGKRERWRLIDSVNGYRELSSMNDCSPEQRHRPGSLWWLVPSGLNSTKVDEVSFEINGVILVLLPEILASVFDTDGFVVLCRGEGSFQYSSGFYGRRAVARHFYLEFESWFL